MSIQSIEIIRGALPLISPFVTSYGVETKRRFLYVHIIGDTAEGWGECVALAEPLYSPEYIDGADAVIRHYLLPLVGRTTTAQEFARAASAVSGHHMAKAAVESALLDYELRASGQSLGDFLGITRTRVPSGVSVGIHSSIDDLLTTVSGYLEDGYQRIKIKIEKGRDIEPVRAVRAAFGDDLLLQVDANSAYSRDDARHLAELDKFNLLLIEQPLADGDLVGHVELSKTIATPICLDESVTSFDLARTAVEMGACTVVNVKPGRVGGLFEAKRIHDYCYERDVAVWCGGMFETGIGRAMNVAFAALPGCALPGDISESRRYFAEDITEAFVLDGGFMSVPTGPGIGVVPRPEMLKKYETQRDLFQVSP